MYPQEARTRNKQKKLFFGRVLKVTDENSRIRSHSGSVRHMYGSAEPVPYQNGTDPQHRYQVPVPSVLILTIDNIVIHIY
jgi:hypothetical protein